MSDRQLKFEVFRFNPNTPEEKPRTDVFEFDEVPRMTLFTALTHIQENLDPSLKFDFVCRAAACGACGIMVNGKPRLACKTRVAELPSSISLMPMPFFRMVGDLSVDTGTWFRSMAERLEGWIHSEEPFDELAEEERMSNAEAEKIYELDRCIECGCCVAACGAAQVNPRYLGPAGMLRMARFAIDPRDGRSDAAVYETVSTDDGVFGCIGLAACDDYCPKDLPIVTQMAYLRRKSASVAWKGS